MPRLLRLLFFIVSGFFAANAALRAHEPLQCTASIAPDEENLAVSVVLSTECSRRLLPESERSAELNDKTFAELRERFLAAAPSVCALVSASDATLSPVRVLVSLNRENEVHYSFLYEADARPARVRMDYLAGQPPGAFCEFADHRVSPPRRAVLTAKVSTFDFNAPAAPSP